MAYAGTAKSNLPNGSSGVDRDLALRRGKAPDLIHIRIGKRDAAPGPVISKGGPVSIGLTMDENVTTRGFSEARCIGAIPSVGVADPERKVKTGLGIAPVNPVDPLRGSAVAMKPLGSDGVRSEADIILPDHLSIPDQLEFSS